ncbi:hypothetical protein N7478_006157 [Penicillium angulare]|uniref:uncharacterized protein n=1 Tax=Penicillium angulare TaxID=116970 RepID=UPI002541D644|nr:uncharacterized protein N7478_006157 [Penicillium angulare]KAJ5280785.1 hypothetical protein N7478_006157 [Penicillium angulare]
MVPSSTLLLFLFLLLTLAYATEHDTVQKRDIDGLVSGSEYNSTEDIDKVICGYQLSGNYCILNRVLYYALIIFSIIGYSHVWLIAGALASALTYSGTAAIHAVILCVASQTGTFDIDILGAWAVVSVACLTVMPIFSFSPSIRESVVSPIFGLWGTLVAIGAICSIVSLNRGFPNEPPCLSSGENPQLLISPSQLADPSFQCTYACFSNRQTLRGPSEMIAIPASLPFEHFDVWQGAAGVTCAVGIYWAVLGFCWPDFRKSTETELRKSIKANKPRSGDLSKARRARAKARKEAHLELETGEYPGPGTTLTVWSVLSTAGAFAVIILNEVFLLHYGGGFPYNEHPYAIGQWGPWVGVLLALTAAGLVRWREPKWKERQEILEKEKKAFDERKALEKQANLMLAGGTVSAPVNSAGQDGEEGGYATKPFVDSFGGDLVRAASTGDVVNVKKYLGELMAAAAVAGVRFNLDKSEAREALVRAAGNGFLEVVKCLLEYGADVEAIDGYGMNALTRAAWAGHEDIVHQLVVRGAKVTGFGGQEAFSRAKANKHTRIVQFLKAHGAPSGSSGPRATRARTQ